MLKGARACGAAAGIRRGAEALAEASPARPDAQSGAPLRPGHGARARGVGRPEIPLRAFPAHAVVGGALRQPACAASTGGFSAHAKDIWMSPDWEKRDKLARAEFGVTCTALGAAHLRALSADPARLDLVYHGLDLSRFPAPPPPRPPRDGSGEAGRPSSRSAGWSRRRATTCCSTRWPSCPPR